jgi:hypothetical protein
MAETAGAESRGRKNLRYGALWCISGIVLLTLGYLASAAGVGSGRQILFGGRSKEDRKASSPRDRNLPRFHRGR